LHCVSAGHSHGRFPLGERLWHKNGVNVRDKPRRAPPPLDDSALRELALRYVGKYATTRAKLREYLTRKIRERGWTGEQPADPETLADRFTELGLVDDASYALARSRALSGRGYGKRRLAEKLRLAGVDEDDSREALDAADAAAVTAALRFAERRRIGPFAAQAPDRAAREKAIAAMVRAGHAFALSRAIAQLPPGANVDSSSLAENWDGNLI
jgi:regulatory protein